MREKLNRLLLPEMEEGLCFLFQTATLSEIYNQRSITLPPSVHAATRRQIIQTQIDLHEYLVDFGFRHGQITTLREEQGTVLDLRTLTGSVEGANGFTVFFGPPSLIAFHTHPTLPIDHLRKHEVTGITFGKQNSNQTKELPLPEASRTLDAYVPYPSAHDLSSIATLPRYKRSMLIGGSWGYTMVINPNLTIPWYLQQNDSLNQYEEQKADAWYDLAVHVSKNSTRAIDTFHQRMRASLHSYCESNGFLLFLGSDPTSPLLVAHE